MAGIPSNKYDLLPYSTTLSSPNSLSYTHHRPSKREYIESSDVEELPSSPPRKFKHRKRGGEWRDSSDIGYSSDIDDDDTRRIVAPGHRQRTWTVAGGETLQDILSSQSSQETPLTKFERILANAITDGLESLDFSECGGLRELPSEIGELKHLVRSAALQHEAPLIPQLKVFLGRNQLATLPFELFSLSNLTVLSLWNNNLTSVPEAIKNLTSLRELNLAGNQLSFLPHTILDLKNLQHLLLYPNPFLAPPPSYAPLPTPPSSQVTTPATMRATHLPLRAPRTSLIPTLAEFASRTLAANFNLTDIGKAPELPEYIRDKAIHAEQRHLWHDVCSICQTWYVDGPIDEGGLGCIEWYDTLYGNDAVPIWRGLCSWGCVEKWDLSCGKTLCDKKE